MSYCNAACHLTVLAACLRLPSEISLPPLAIFFTARWMVLMVLSVYPSLEANFCSALRSLPICEAKHEEMGRQRPHRGFLGAG